MEWPWQTQPQMPWFAQGQQPTPLPAGGPPAPWFPPQAPQGMQPAFDAAVQHQQRWGMPPAMDQVGSILARTAQIPADIAMMGPRFMGDVMEGRVDPGSQEGIRRSMEVAMSLAGGGALGAERGTLGALGGRLSFEEPPRLTMPKGAREEIVGHSLPITSAEGNEIGQVKFEDRGDHVKILAPDIWDKSQRGKGYATQTYKDLADWAIGNGKELHSSNSVSESAQRVYGALERRGYKVDRALDAEPLKSIIDGNMKMVSPTQPVFKITGFGQ